MSEAVERYRRLADQFAQRVEAASDDAWSQPSPCEEWTAREVVAHIVNGQRGLTAAINGGTSAPLGADEDPKVAFRDSYAAFLEVLEHPENLTKNVPGPMGEMPLELLVGRFLATDVMVHTWDLARAVGGDERLDGDAVHHAFEGLKPIDAMLRMGGVFGEKVEPPEGADEQTQFLCFLGRRP